MLAAAGGANASNAPGISDAEWSVVRKHLMAAAAQEGERKKREEAEETERTRSRTCRTSCVRKNEKEREEQERAERLNAPKKRLKKHRQKPAAKAPKPAAAPAQKAAPADDPAAAQQLHAESRNGYRATAPKREDPKKDNKATPRAQPKRWRQ